MAEIPEKSPGEPQPTSSSDIRVLERFFVFSACVVVVIAGLRAAESIVAPILMAALVTAVTVRPLQFLRKRGFPEWLAVLTVLSGVLVANLLLAGILGSNIRSFRQEIPMYQARLQEISAHFLDLAARIGIPIPEQTYFEMVNPGAVMRYAAELFNSVGSLVTDTFLIILLVVFMLAEVTSLPARLQSVLQNPERSLERWSRVIESINDYLIVKTFTSIATGVFVAVWLTLFGVGHAILWGVLAFMLNYVPNIGSILAAVPAVLLALVEHGAGTAGWVALGYFIVNNVIGNFVEPRYMGSTLGLSSLVVFVSLVLWGWILGPIGMFLSVPLTMILKISLDASPETRWVAVLLEGGKPRLPSQE